MLQCRVPKEQRYVTRAAIMGMLVAAVVIAAPCAQAEVICARRTGGVFVRDACRTHERPLDPAAFGVAGPPGQPGPAGPPGPTSDWLPENKTLRGVFALVQEPGALIWTMTSISFGLQIHGIGENRGPWPVYVTGDETRPECPGNFQYPKPRPDTCACTSPIASTSNGRQSVSTTISGAGTWRGVTATPMESSSSRDQRGQERCGSWAVGQRPPTPRRPELRNGLWQTASKGLSS